MCLTSAEISIKDIWNLDQFNAIDILVKCISDTFIKNIDENEYESFLPTPPSFTTEQYNKLDYNLLSDISMFLGEKLIKILIYFQKNSS